MRGVSILERLAGLRDGVLQSFTQKPQSPPHREMTVAHGTASAHDSPIPATAWTDEWPPHAAAAHPHRPRTRVRAHRRLHRVRAACGRSVSVACHRAPAACDAAGVPLRTHRPVSPACPAPLPVASRRFPSLPVASRRFPSLPVASRRFHRSRRFSHFCRPAPREPVKCAPSSRGRAARPFARRQPIVPPTISSELSTLLQSADSRTIVAGYS